MVIAATTVLRPLPFPASRARLAMPRSSVSSVVHSRNRRQIRPAGHQRLGERSGDPPRTDDGRRSRITDGGRRAGERRRGVRSHDDIGEPRSIPGEEPNLTRALRATESRDDLHRGVTVHIQLGAGARDHELHVHPAVVRPPRLRLPGGAGVDLPRVEPVQHRRVLRRVRLAAQVLAQVEQLIVVVRGGTERDAGKSGHLAEGDVELDRAVLHLLDQVLGADVAQHQGTAPAIELDAPFGGADVPCGAVEGLLRARDGGERRDAERDECAEAREGQDVGFHAPTLSQLVANVLDFSEIQSVRGRSADKLAAFGNTGRLKYQTAIATAEGGDTLSELGSPQQLSIHRYDYRAQRHQHRTHRRI